MRFRTLAVLARMALLAAVLSASLAPAGPAAAARTLHVAPDGSDRDPGTGERPFATLAHALHRVEPGDTIVLRGGTYREREIVAERGGRAGAPVVIRSQRGETAVLDGSAAKEHAPGLNIVADHVQIHGLEIRNSRGPGILVHDSAHVEVRDNVVRDNRGPGIQVSSNRHGGVADVVMDGNLLTGNSREHEGAADTAWQGAISVLRGTRITISDNEVVGNRNKGIVLNALDSSVAHNVVRNNNGAQVILDGTANSTVHHNFITAGEARSEAGILLITQTAAPPFVLENNRIEHNVVSGSASAIAYRNLASGGGFRNSVVANNTLTGATASLLRFDSDPRHVGTSVRDNVFAHADGAMLDGQTQGFRFAGNCWHGSHPEGAAGPGDVTGDPRLRNPGGATAADYALTASSPCTGKGAAVADLPGGAAVAVAAAEATPQPEPQPEPSPASDGDTVEEPAPVVQAVPAKPPGTPPPREPTWRRSLTPLNPASASAPLPGARERLADVLLGVSVAAGLGAGGAIMLHRRRQAITKPTPPPTTRRPGGGVRTARPASGGAAAVTGAAHASANPPVRGG